MHKYLEAIGFHKIKSEKAWSEILEDIECNYTAYERISLESDLDFCALSKEYGDRIGVQSCGQVGIDEEFVREYYYPYFAGSGITSYADVLVERRSDREAYLGVCEDEKVGISLIFHLLNGTEYREEQSKGRWGKGPASVTLSGLACSGTVLLPVLKTRRQEQQIREESRNRMRLLSAAREGNTEAIENLTMEDIDTYSEVSRRLLFEDVYSIVDTYFMPCGFECDQYSIMGEILSMDRTVNSLTGEVIRILTLDVNELRFDVCVPEERLTGEPAVGRRFKADIWLQGWINL